MKVRPITEFTPVAERFEGEAFGRPGCWLFRLKESPDNLSHMMVEEGGIRSLLRNWDRKSNINHTFDGGNNMLIPSNVLQQVVDAFTVEF